MFFPNMSFKCDSCWIDNSWFDRFPTMVWSNTVFWTDVDYDLFKKAQPKWTEMGWNGLGGLGMRWLLSGCSRSSSRQQIKMTTTTFANLIFVLILWCAVNDGSTIILLLLICNALCLLVGIVIGQDISDCHHKETVNIQHQRTIDRLTDVIRLHQMELAQMRKGLDEVKRRHQRELWLYRTPEPGAWDFIPGACSTPNPGVPMEVDWPGGGSDFSTPSAKTKKNIPKNKKKKNKYKRMKCPKRR